MVQFFTVLMKDLYPKDVSSSIIGTYVEATPINKASDTVTFKTSAPGLSVALPPSMLKPGDNTVTISGKVRVVFNTGNGQKWIDASNSESMSFTIKSTGENVLRMCLQKCKNSNYHSKKL